MEWQAYARGKIQENQGIKIKTDFFLKATDSLVDIQSYQTPLHQQPHQVNCDNLFFLSDLL